MAEKKFKFNHWRAYMRALGHCAPHCKDSAAQMQMIFSAAEAGGYPPPNVHDPAYLAQERAIWRVGQRVPYWRAKGHNEHRAIELACSESGEFWDEDLALSGHVATQEAAA